MGRSIVASDTVAVAVVAPGAPMTSDYLGGDVATFWGTSQASPAVAAVGALMKQCRPQITPDEIRIALQRKFGNSYHFWKSARSLDVLNGQALSLLDHGHRGAEPSPGGVERDREDLHPGRPQIEQLAAVTVPVRHDATVGGDLLSFLRHARREALHEHLGGARVQ